MNSYALRPWHISFLVHFCCVCLFFVFTLVKIPEKELIEVPIEIESPKEIQNLAKVEERPNVVLKSVNTPEDTARKNVRQIFGASRRSHTDNSVSDTEAVSAKKGNTLAKAVDTEVLKDSDADVLPTPTEEYLVSEMPMVLSEVKPNYPKEAKDKKMEGTVSMDVLVDSSGKVRQVSVIEGDHIFRNDAVTAMKRFIFKPAQVDGKPVAVRIRYTVRFQLEY